MTDPPEGLPDGVTEAVENEHPSTITVHFVIRDGMQDLDINMENTTGFQILGAAEVLRIAGSARVGAALAMADANRANQSPIVRAMALPQDHKRPRRVS